ncbi:MAG TPA: hypothetical protein VM686_33445 [Polyangiaceae bacterium]|nr:hypothetical protein [Polyangiaceae bacterium]
MRKALRTSVILVSAVFLAASCGLVESEDKEDPAPAPTAGTAGTTGIGIGDGGQSGATGAGGNDGSSAPPGCEELEGLGDCGVTSLEANYDIANIMLVIDKSKSMVDQPEGFDTDKWAALKSALDESLNDVSGDANFGLILYPFSLDEEIPSDTCQGSICCEVPAGSSAVNVAIQPGADAIPQILDALDGTEPSGGTPTAAALQSAFDYFVNGEGSMLEGDRYVLLATDGGPNCNTDNSCDAETCTYTLDGQCSNNCCADLPEGCLDDADVVAQIEALAAEGIPTFVVGIPGTELYAAYLNDFATAGGVPNSGDPQYYAVEATGGVEALAQTFTDITTHLVRSCEIELATEPPNLELVNVAVDCKVVPSEDGAEWEIAEGSTTLQLKGSVCNFVEGTGARRVDVVYGCPMIR